MYIQGEALWEVANLSLVVLGFSGIVSVLGRRALGEWTQGDVKRFNLMGIAGLRLLIAALLPMIFIHFGFSGKTLWAISSGTMTVIYCVVAFSIFRILQSYDAGTDSSPFVNNSVRPLFLLSIVVLALNATGILFEPSFGPYFLVLMMNLAISILYVIRPFSTGLFTS